MAKEAETKFDFDPLGGRQFPVRKPSYSTRKLTVKRFNLRVDDATVEQDQFPALTDLTFQVTDISSHPHLQSNPILITARGQLGSEETSIQFAAQLNETGVVEQLRLI